MTTKRQKTKIHEPGRKVRRLLEVNVPNDREQAMMDFMNGNIVGQPGLVGVAGRAYRQAFNPLRNKKRPIYVVFLLGQRGTGKTLTPSMVSKFLHQDEEALIRIPCGAYKEKHRISQLLGAPPSYVGHRDPDKAAALKPSQIDPSARLSRHNIVASRKGSDVPVSVLVFDEIEKASEDLEHVLLSIMYEGQVDLGSNEPTDFRDCIIFLTGNVAAFELSKLGRSIGFHAGVKVVSQDDIESTVKGVLENRYAPEFIDRIDEVVIAQKLGKDDLRAILDVHIGLFVRRIQDELPRGQQFDITVDEAARKFLFAQATRGSDSARGISRAINRYIEQPLGGELTKNSISLGDLVEITHEEGNEGLSFYLVEDGGTTSAADQMVVVGERGAGAKLGMQRRLARAEMAASKKEKLLYCVSVRAKGHRALAETAGPLQHDMTAIFGLKVVKTVMETEEPPFSLEFYVRGVDEQIELLRETYPEVTVKRIDEEKAA
ncbi:MAG: ATP-dependent Clp protease ATP-binding subunit [Candidatus Melainabacteria bacterium]|nr:ATP-dependent Clp protease ATP-binding subunit [Candidatus Melainabacteria bacterium]